MSILGLKVFQHQIQSIVYDFWGSEGGAPIYLNQYSSSKCSDFPDDLFLIYLLYKMN